MLQLGVLQQEDIVVKVQSEMLKLGDQEQQQGCLCHSKKVRDNDESWGHHSPQSHPGAQVL